MELIFYGKYRALVARLNGELDHHIADSVREEIDRELERTGAVNVAFDFRHQVWRFWFAMISQKQTAKVSKKTCILVLRFSKKLGL